MGRMLEALRQIEAKKDAETRRPGDAEKNAVSASPCLRVSVSSPALPAVDPAVVDALFDEADFGPQRPVPSFAALTAVPYEAVDDAPVDATTTPFAPLRDVPSEDGGPATSLTALAARLHAVHDAQAPAMLLFCDVGAGCAALVGRLADELTHDAERPTPVLDAAGTFAARLTELRSEQRLVLLHGTVASDDALALCRHCDGVYLVVTLGATSEAQLTSAIARIDQFGGRLLGAVAVE